MSGAITAPRHGLRQRLIVGYPRRLRLLRRHPVGADDAHRPGLAHGLGAVAQAARLVIGPRLLSAFLPDRPEVEPVALDYLRRGAGICLWAEARERQDRPGADGHCRDARKKLVGPHDGNPCLAPILRGFAPLCALVAAP